MAQGGGASAPQETLARERARARVDSGGLAAALAGGAGALARRRELTRLLEGHAWARKDDRAALGREALYLRALEGLRGLKRLVAEHSLSFRDVQELRRLLDLPSGFELHLGMFIPTLLGQATEAQQSEWLAPALNFEIVGTYAQTELGHGTFLRGLETTATWAPRDPDDPEGTAGPGFVLDSPTPTSSKWWPGGLGKTANCAVVMARLISSNGRDQGPHPFLVRLRCARTHLPLPGVQVGDIGPKLGYNSVDNGFLRFSRVFLPLKALLAKHSRVTADGQYVPPPPKNQKASYATMVWVRADIVAGAGDTLSKAATISTRYAAIRRQGGRAPAAGGGAGARTETQLLDYGHVRRTLLVEVARAYALRFTGRWMMEMYRNFDQEQKRGDFFRLPELHATSSGLKALCTWMASEGVERCRQTCGGQGYSELSGLPSLLTSYVQNMTWEGDNHVLCLQCARYLVKQMRAVRSSRTPPRLAGSVAYLLEGRAMSGVVRGTAAAADPEGLLKRGAVSAVLRALGALEAASGAHGGADGELLFEGQAWDSVNVPMVRAARAHCLAVLCQTFAESLPAFCREHGLDGHTAAALEGVRRLFALEAVEASRGDLLEAGLIDPSGVEAVRAALNGTLDALRPEAVALVDAFGFPDYALNSCIGAYDGDVYTRLLAAAAATPLNATQQGPGWEPLLKDFLEENRVLGARAKRISQAAGAGKGEKNTEEAPLGATRFSNSTSPPPTAQSPERRIPADIDPRKPRPKL